MTLLLEKIQETLTDLGGFHKCGTQRIMNLLNWQGSSASHRGGSILLPSLSTEKINSLLPRPFALQKERGASQLLLQCLNAHHALFPRHAPEVFRLIEMLLVNVSRQAIVHPAEGGTATHADAHHANGFHHANGA